MALPERRKSAEELAKLRESLGISPDGPPPGAPGTRPAEPAAAEVEELKAAVFSPPPEPVAVEEPASVAVDDPEPAHRPPPSLRKSKGLVVDQPKPVRHRAGGSLPVRRHTDEELLRLRRIDSGPAVSPVEVLARKTLSLPGVILLYLLAATSVSLLVMESLWLSTTPAIDLPFEWLRDFTGAAWYRSAMIGAVGGTGALALLVAGWVAWRRPLSRHHAGFAALIAGLVLVFGTLYFFPELHGA